MRWRLFWFVLTRRAFLRQALIAVAAAVLLGLLGSRLAAGQEFTLSVRLSEPQFASEIEVRNVDGVAIGQLPSRANQTALFHLPRGDYLVTAVPNGVAVQQHWAYGIIPVHLDRDRGLSVRGSYGVP